MNSLQLLSAPYPRKRNSLLFVPLLVLGLAGCGTMMQGMSEDMIAVKSDNKSCTPFLEESSAGIGTEKRKLSSEKIAAHVEKFLKMEWGQEAGADRGDDPINQYDPINQFLDCVIAPVAPNDFEARLFRGHVVTVLLARYGAFNITGEVGNLIDIDFRAYPEMVEDSATLLTHIEIAQGLLRSASKVARKNPDFADPSTKALRGVPRVLRTYRILGTLTVAIDAERPTYRRASRAVRNIIAAAVTCSPEKPSI